MADNRKVLTAKRKNERDKGPNLTGNNKSRQLYHNFKQGIKRPNDTPKKNLANERLKRLRVSLNEEVRNSPKEHHKSVPSTATQNRLNKQNRNSSCRKRSQNVPEQDVAVKVPRQGTTVSKEATFVKKEHIIQTSHASVLTTVTQCSSNVTQECMDSVEDMEWSTTDDLLSNASTSKLESRNTTDDKGLQYKNNYFVVVDTNIFLSHLCLIKEIITMKVAEGKDPVIFIPWIVIEELDFIKEDSNKTDLKFKAREAIKYIETTLRGKHGRMKGQTLNEVNEQKSVGTSQDNKIIACCLQVLEKYKNMILLTGDTNLKNKAHFNNIPVCSHTEIKTKILHTLNESKAQLILEKMTELCNIVIRECAKNAYGNASTKMPICQTSPKSVEECISIFRKYWFPVFQEHLMKQFRKSIDDLSSFLIKNTVINDNTDELGELLRLCVRVCLFLKDVECCKDTIENTIRYLNDIKGS